MATNDVILPGLEFLEDSDRPCSRRMNADVERALFHRVEQYVKEQWDGSNRLVGPLVIDGWHILVAVKRLPDKDGRQYVSYTALCSDPDGPIPEPEGAQRA